MSERRRLMIRYLQRLDEIAPLGYALGTHIRFASPLFTRSTLPRAWQETYEANAYSLRDPMIFWGISKAGAIRWSEITLPDPFGVMKKAAEFGLRYGATTSCGKITSRTLVGVARDDREFDDDEIAEVATIGQALHELSEPPRAIEPAMIEAMRLIGQGMSRSETASKLGISEAVLEQRLEGAQQRLGARTIPEALKMARDYKLI